MKLGVLRSYLRQRSEFDFFDPAVASSAHAKAYGDEYQLANVISDISGQNRLAIIRAIVHGNRVPIGWLK